jgi:hypothetical protein
MLKIVVLLTDCNQYTGGALYLLSEILARELLKSRGMHQSHTKNQFFHHQVGVDE